ncbi:glutathione S-transferase family protein [Sneathiella limimaris]|uniref:glutathione S-transferase family protein n=1 Tax=Sneathiella limimaris TaxID=1964213 RepID=UPI00146AB464|nr:glutathione S-transferase family protein [Sneathiella limimaris]
MYYLYWEYMAGSIVVQAMLEELGVPYELRYVDMGAGEHFEPAYRELNPVCRVPALGLPDGTTIGETAAIVAFLGEQYPAKRLTPLPGEHDRAEFLFWLNVLTTSGYLTVSRWAHPERYAADADAIQQVEQKAALDLEAFYAVIETEIGDKPCFLDRGFSALDFYLTMLTEWSGDRQKLLSDCPNLSRLVEKTSARASYIRTLQTHKLPEAAE